MDGYITIADYAKVKGISKQAVYQSLNTKLSQFYKEVVQDGRKQKVISLSALSSEELKAFNKLHIKGKESVKQAGPMPEAAQQEGISAQFLQLLREQLQEKDRQIAELQAALETERAHAREQADKITALADQAQRLQLAQMAPQKITGAAEEGEEQAQPKGRRWFSLWK